MRQYTFISAAREFKLLARNEFDEGFIASGAGTLLFAVDTHLIGDVTDTPRLFGAAEQWYS